MLEDVDDVVKHVVKWLLMPVGQYLEMGSPKQDYATLPASAFIKTKQADIDVGQIFHNFPAHESERLSLGVRYIETHNYGAHKPHTLWRWTRMPFGSKPLPWLCCQGQMRINEACKGDRHVPSNEWQWERVWLNLWTAQGYDCSMLLSLDVTGMRPTMSGAGVISYVRR